MSYTPTEKRKSEVGFKECLIVPLEIFNKRMGNSSNSTTTTSTVNTSSNHPSLLRNTTSTLDTVIPGGLIDKENSSTIAPPTEISETKKIERLKNEYSSAKSDEILASDLPDDLKIKLYNESIRHPGNNQSSSFGDREGLHGGHSTAEKSTIADKQEIQERILTSMPNYAKSTVKNILYYILNRPHVVSWDPYTLEIMFNNSLVRGTNIIRILRFLTLDPNMHSGTESAPHETSRFREKLLKIGVPNSWMNKAPMKHNQYSSSFHGKKEIKEEKIKTEPKSEPEYLPAEREETKLTPIPSDPFASVAGAIEAEHRRSPKSKIRKKYPEKSRSRSEERSHELWRAPPLEEELDEEEEKLSKSTRAIRKKMKPGGQYYK